MSSIASRVEVAIRSRVKQIQAQIPGRTYRAANELRNAEQRVLRGKRSGRKYLVPNTRRHYTASAPGQRPAQRTGAFRLSWHPSVPAAENPYIARIESDLTTDRGGYVLGELLENGTSRMAPRPYKDEIVEKARPAIKKIYKEPYQ